MITVNHSYYIPDVPEALLPVGRSEPKWPIPNTILHIICWELYRPLCT